MMNVIIMQCKAELRRIFRNPYYVFWSLILPIIFYYIFTRIVNTNPDDKGLWQAHYLMSMTTFSVMGSSIMTLGIRIVQERVHGWSTYMRITPLPEGVYFFGKMFGQSVMHLFSIIIIFTAGYLINGVSLTASQWILSGLWILIGCAPFLALGTLVGTMKKVDTASGVSNAIYMVLAVLGAMWFPLDSFPKGLQLVSKWLPSYNFGNGAWELIQGNAPRWDNILILSGYLVFFVVLSTYIRKKQEVV